ncbi:MAG: hypothetical protein WBP45_10830, partial [Daejeonella sp.]
LGEVVIVGEPVHPDHPEYNFPSGPVGGEWGSGGFDPGNTGGYNEHGGGSGGRGGNAQQGAKPVEGIVTRDRSMLNNPKANCILNKLENNNTKFDSLIDAFTGNEYDLVFKVDDLPLKSDGTRANGQTSAVGSKFSITLDRSFIRDYTPIEVAKTFLHEAYHANLSQHAYAVFGNLEVSTWTARPEDMTITELMDKISLTVAGNKQLEQVEHEYMASNISSISKGLSEIMQEHSSNFGSFTDDHFTALAYSGLQNTKFYMNLIEGKTKEYLGREFSLADYNNMLRSIITGEASINCP